MEIGDVPLILGDVTDVTLKAYNTHIPNYTNVLTEMYNLFIHGCFFQVFYLFCAALE